MSTMDRARQLGASVAGQILGGAARLDRGRLDVVGVLTYHRVVDPERPVAPGIASATPDEFARQMTLLANAYRPISLVDLMRRAGGGQALPRRSVLVTFDDAYRDFATIAWPILRELKIPAVLFVPTAFPDTTERFWWDRLYSALSGAEARPTWMSPLGPLPMTNPAERVAAYRRLREQVKSLGHADGLALVASVEADLVPRAGATVAAPPGDVLGWSELRALAADGVELAAHSRSHPLLTRISGAELDDEIRGSMDDLAEQLGRPPMAAFAYPSGTYSPTVREAAARNGIKVAFTTDRGLNDLRRSDWLALHRINVGQRTDGRWLRAQLGSRLGPLVTSIAERRGQPRPVGASSERAPARRG